MSKNSRDLLYRNRAGTRPCIFQVSVLAQLKVKLLKKKKGVTYSKKHGNASKEQHLVEQKLNFLVPLLQICRLFFSAWPKLKKIKHSMQSQVRLVRKCDECFMPRKIDPEDQDCAQALAPDINTALRYLNEMCSTWNRLNTEKSWLDLLNSKKDKHLHKECNTFFF